jgi:hypothetical protein
MPQSERANILKEILKWLTTKAEGATTAGLKSHIKWEITEGGATDTAIKKYIDDMNDALLIEYKHPHWLITGKGKMWLEIHQI